ncbi:N-formylglutamate deformylase [Lichenihabitans psoromatis]|uniref:N-formylglutamate deformylase n=1 Tax=Lichenihabitans psoromatis TaxID=2528642 RepID=UPI001035D769|nr:N-formylglutamate deformylase [Lichenihabitans psoromatis]
MDSNSAWLRVTRGTAPLLVSLPHTGTDLPDNLVPRLVSPWLARKDADWWIDKLYDFASDLDATVVHTSMSRTVIDVNRDPSGVSLYPGQATTDLCPVTTFDGEALYRSGADLRSDETAERQRLYFDPYHAALADEIARLKRSHDRVVVYDCHSIRSLVPRLFEGILPHFNIGTNSGASCDAALTQAVESACDASGFDRVTNGRFKGGFITRRYGRPGAGVHAIQMELACRGYLREEPGPVSEGAWPPPYDESFAAPIRSVLRRVLKTSLGFAIAGRQD